MEALKTSDYPDPLEDWNLNQNVECKFILNKLDIKTPEYETMEFCRNLTNTTKDMGFDFKSEFVLDVLLNDILRKCDGKCGLCEEYVQQLRHHITQAHSTSQETQTVFKCDICSSIYSSPSMLIRHRNTHSDNSDTLTTAQCEKSENHPHHPIWPKNSEWNTLNLKHESSESESELEIPDDFNADDLRDPASANSNPLEILQNMNHFLTIAKSMKQESDDVECQEDLLILQDTDLQVPSFVKFECTEIFTETEQHTVFMTHEKSSNVTTTGEKSFPVPSDLIRQELTPTESQSSGHNPNPLEILQNMNYFLTIAKSMKQESDDVECIPNNVKQECDESECQEDLKDPLLLQEINMQVPSFVKYEYTGISTASVSEDRTVFMTHEKSSSDTLADGGESSLVPSDSITHKITQSVQKPHKCDICGKCFDKSRGLSRHKLIHSGKNPHKCGVCGKCFTQKSDLTRHKLTHTGEKSFHCDVCGRRFAQGSNLRQHNLTHTGERPHKCDTCGRRFARESTLMLHKLTHTGEKSFHCDVCGRSFSLKSYLTAHKLTHTGAKGKLHTCDVCEQNFYEYSELSQHKLVHTGKKLHKCDVCGKCFLRSDVLKRHNLTHTGEKSFGCDVCGKCFSERSNLTKHTLVHTGEKPHECDVCGKCFTLNFNLTKHKLTHTKGK